MTSSKQPKQKHEHKLIIDRTGFDPKTKFVEYIDTHCDCGLKLFIDGNFSWHTTDFDGGSLTMEAWKVNYSPKKKTK